MRLLRRLLLSLLVASVVVRVAIYLYYASVQLRTPLEAHNLEAQMVLLAWRARQGLSLYPAWWDYPHVANIYGPVYFVAVGLAGRFLDVDIPGLFAIGRAVSFGSGLLTSVVVGAWLGRRYGRGAGVVGGLFSLGSGPMYGFTVMVRCDATAELLGVAGYFLSGSRSRPTRIAGVALLVLSALTKQTAGVFLMAAGLGLALERRWREAAMVLGGGLATLIALLVAGNELLEPHLVRSLFGTSSMPWDFGHWYGLLRGAALSTPDIFFFPAVGLWLWLGEEPRDVRPAVLVLVILASSLGLSAMVGADMNYYLSLRVAEGMAAGALWHAWGEAGGRSLVRKGVLTATTVLAILAVGPCIQVAIRQVVHATRKAAMLERPEGRLVLYSYRNAFALARDPRVRLLTDSGLVDLYQGERAAFGDPWLFRERVELGRIKPTTIRKRIESQYYDWIITTHELNSARYINEDFRLPMDLARRARISYVLRAAPPGLFFYVPRVGGGSAVADPGGALAR